MTEAWLAEALARGRARWPDLTVGADELADAIRARELPLDEVDVAEVYLGCACSRGDADALLAFRAAYFAPLEATLSRMGLDADRKHDVWQALAVRLFTRSDDAPPRIAGYAGRGQLHGLVKVAVTRLALDALEREERYSSDDWLEQLPGGSSDPELHWIKQQHRSELKQEIEAAIGELAARDRALLRLSLVERVGIDAIAASYRTHRSTVARWITRARDDLAERVRTRLAARWRMTDGELRSLRMMVDSQLDLSLERLLSAS